MNFLETNRCHLAVRTARSRELERELLSLTALAIV
jgi:hypothetical protein